MRQDLVKPTMSQGMRPLAALAAVYFGTLGAVLGSFAGLLVDRVPRREPILRSRSRCRSCGHRLGVVDLLPVAGYLVRGGRCTYCRTAIPARWPLLELGFACWAAGAVMTLGLVIGALAGILGIVLASGCLVGWAWWRRRRGEDAAGG